MLDLPNNRGFRIELDRYLQREYNQDPILRAMKLRHQRSIY